LCPTAVWAQRLHDPCRSVLCGCVHAGQDRARREGFMGGAAVHCGAQQVFLPARLPMGRGLPPAAGAEVGAYMRALSLPCGTSPHVCMLCAGQHERNFNFQFSSLGAAAAAAAAAQSQIWSRVVSTAMNPKHVSKGCGRALQEGPLGAAACRA